MVVPEGPNPVVPAPAASLGGGGPTSRVGEGEEEVDEARVTTRADTPDSPSPSVVVPADQLTAILCRCETAKATPRKVLAVPSEVRKERNHDPPGAADVKNHPIDGFG